MPEPLRPAGDQLLDTRKWRSPALVGGDGIEPPASNEVAEHNPSHNPSRWTSGLARLRHAGRLGRYRNSRRVRMSTPDEGGAPFQPDLHSAGA